jgi:NDP-sugar pyrophosphorylase family protein
MPKCLVPLHGKAILQCQLEALDRAGIQDCLLVVGYMADQIRARFGSSYGGVSMAYVENPRFNETNNLYSLWLARHHMDDDILLLEGDLVFDEELLVDVIQSRRQDTAVVDAYRPHMDGTVVLARHGEATAMVLKSEQAADFDYRSALKTVNIYRFSRATIQRSFLPALDRFVAQGRTDQFYEAVLAEMVSRGTLALGVHYAAPRRWAEIDTAEDLREAHVAFQPSRRPAVAMLAGQPTALSALGGLGRPARW